MLLLLLYFLISFGMEGIFARVCYRMLKCQLSSGKIEILGKTSTIFNDSSVNFWNDLHVERLTAHIELVTFHKACI